jgi:hypothetical protein
MARDTRLWMYRKGEARLFDHPDQVPGDEDWRRFPVAEDADLSRPMEQNPSEEDIQVRQELSSLPRQRLMQVAGRRGIRFAFSWTNAQLVDAISEAMNGDRA